MHLELIEFHFRERLLPFLGLLESNLGLQLGWSGCLITLNLASVPSVPSFFLAPLIILNTI